MAELGTVYVDVKGDFKQMERETSSKMGGFATKAAKIFAATFAAKKVFDFGASSVGAANDLAESANAIAQTFSAAVLPQIEAIGATSAESFGLAESEFNSFAVQFAGFAERIDPGNVGGVIEDVATRVADFASVMNLEVGEAGGEFQSIMAGSSEVARKYGLDVSAAAVEQYALENGLAASKSEMTEGIKIQARYGILMQQTEKWAGDFANTSDQLANSQRIAAASFEDVKAELGQALLPVLGEVVGLIRTAVIPLVSSLQPVFVLAADAIAQLAPPIIELVTRLLPLVEKIMPFFVKILTKVIAVVLELVTPILDLVFAALDPLLEILLPLVDVLFEALAPALEVVAELVVALMPLIDLLIPLISATAQIAGFLATIVGEVLAAAIGVLAGMIERAIGWITPFVEWLTDLAGIIGGALSDNLDGIIEWFQGLPDVILSAVDGAVDWLVETGKNLIRGLIDGVKSMASTLVTAIKNFVIDKIPGPIKSFFGINSPSTLMAEYGRNISQGMAAGIRAEADQVDKAVQSLLSRPGGNIGVTSDLSLAGVGAGGFSMTFNGPVGGDMTAFTEQVMQAAARERRFYG